MKIRKYKKEDRNNIGISLATTVCRIREESFREWLDRWKVFDPRENKGLVVSWQTKWMCRRLGQLLATVKLESPVQKEALGAGEVQL
ncbi:hypothetical protein [Microbulbifer sp. JTAC008]|uniref:hypothetical protein n=1 Tax=unclassified Microbulbifer TaxID=2619833 RepID=UPI004039950B